MEDQEILYNRAAKLLYAVWRRIPTSYKSQYRRTIWDQFAAAIRTSALTSDLSKAFNSICSKFNAHAAFTDEARLVIAELSAPDQKAILRLWRNEARTLAVMVQALNEEDKEVRHVGA